MLNVQWKKAFIIYQKTSSNTKLLLTYVYYTEKPSNELKKQFFVTAALILTNMQQPQYYTIQY